jgi:DNA-binding MarR family transcriptional regulator
MAGGRLEKEIRQGRPLPMEERVYLNLLRTADRLLRHEAAVLKAHGLSSPQYNVLRILRGARPDGLACREVGNRMVTRDPDVTRLLDRLEQQGLVSRVRELKDRRVITAHITSKGVGLVDRLDEPLRDLLRGKLAHMSRTALGRLNSLLEEVRSAER